jgi:hypothetical protein
MMYRGVQLIWYKKNWYHPNFFKKRKTCVKQAKYTCQRCGIRRHEEYITQDGNKAKAVMQAAHRYHDPWNPRAELICLCKPCHLWYDAPMHADKGSKTKRRKKSEKIKDDSQEELSLKFKQKAVKLQKGMNKLIDDEWISEKLLEPPKKNAKQVIIVHQYLLLEGDTA